MPEADRKSGGGRRWRSLARALVVAGAALAGTSAAWLAGSPADAADLQPPAAEETDGGQAEPAAKAAEPERFDLLGLDPAQLIRDPGSALLAPAGEVLHEFAVEPVERVATPVRQVASSAVSETGERAESLSESVGGLGTQLHRPQWSEVPPAPQRPAGGTTTAPPPQPAPAPAPAMVDGPQERSPQVQPEPEKSAVPAFTERAPVMPEPQQVPRSPRPFAVPAPASGSTGCGNAADGHPHNAVGIGWHSSGSHCAELPAWVPVRGAAPAPAGSPGPQPGITPD